MPKTVKVRIAVAVEDSGNWSAFGENEFCVCGSGKHCEGCVMNDAVERTNPDFAHQEYWLEAELPIPEPKTVQATNVETVEE